MKEFGQRGTNTLRRLDPGAKFLYTAFLLFSLAGLASAGALHLDGMGTSGVQAGTYWLGDDTGMAYPKSFRQLVELTHFHLFTEPVSLLVVAHLYHLGGDLALRKRIAIMGTTAAVAVQIALPWALVYGSGAFGVLMFPATIVLIGGFLYMSTVATADMWGKDPKPSA